MRVRVDYFAALREQRGISSEEIRTECRTALELYRELSAEHGFTLDPKIIRVSLNDEFAPADVAINEGDSIVFIPPVAGG